MENIENVNEEEYKDDEMYVITPHCLLYETLKDYGIEVGPWLPKMWDHIFNDFMEGLCKSGYISKGDCNED